MLSSAIYKLCKIFCNNDQYINMLRRGGGVKIGTGCVIDKSVEFGTEPFLINIANDVRITSGVKFITHDGSLWVVRNLGLVDRNSDYFGKIEIGSNTNIGWNAIVLPGVKIGRNCIVAAGAVVTKSVPDNSVVAGVPAHFVETVEDYAQKKRKSCVLTKQMSKADKKAYLMSMYNL